MTNNTRTLQILIVDDELAIRQILASAISKAGHVASVAADGRSALVRLGQGDIDIAICDIRMPDISGIDVINAARQSGIDTTFLMMTAFASVNTAIDAMKAGAFDYMLKPLRNDELLGKLERLGDVIGLRSENQMLRQIVLGEHADHCALASQPMVEIDRLIAKVAPTNSTVLITGPSGVGKGVIARQIHRNSRKAAGPFIPVNCGAIPENLLESEFYGHTKGAFTGADKAKRGLFVEADQGTIFLDEVGELPLNLQVKLLHVLEERSVRALGSAQSRRIDVRVIAATNSDIEQMVSAGAFREDLYFRLNAFRIDLPPLASRPEDLERLIDFYLPREGRKLGSKQKVEIDPDARAKLCHYRWPGNLRELQNVISRAIILSDDNRVRLRDLPHEVTGAISPAINMELIGGGTLKEQVRVFELMAIKNAIDAEGGDRRRAARALGIGLSSLYRKMEEDQAPFLSDEQGQALDGSL